jgi:hypothetical protein
MIQVPHTRCFAKKIYLVSLRQIPKFRSMTVSSNSWLLEVQAQLEAVAQKPGGSEGSAQLLKALKQLDVILTRHRTEMPNDLVHYLERRSYEKASKFCEGLVLDPAYKSNSRH